MVMKRKLADDPEAFAKASPIDLTGPQAPPMYVVHGSHDTLAPVEDARDLVAQLREQSKAPVLYAEMQGAAARLRDLPVVPRRVVIEGIEALPLHRCTTSTSRAAPAATVRTAEVVEPLVEN